MKTLKTIELEIQRAIFHGWQEKLKRTIEIVTGEAETRFVEIVEEEYDNPETYDVFMQKKWTEYKQAFDDNFFAYLKDKRYEEKIAGLREVAETEVIAEVLPTK